MSNRSRNEIFKILKWLFFSIFIFLCIQSCKKEDDPEPEPDPAVFKIKYLGHRGTGSDSFSGKDSLFPSENSYDAIIMGCQMLNGSETDIQMSQDGTVWLWHNELVNSTDTQNTCIPCLTDIEIQQKLPSGKTIVKLDSVLQWLSNHSGGKYLSLDVKGYFPSCPIVDHTSYFERMSDSVVSMLSKYNLYNNVVVETDYTMFLDMIKSKMPAVDCYFLTYGNMKQSILVALNNNYDGLSMMFSDTSLTTSNMSLLRSNNLKIQLWSLYYIQDVEYVKTFSPDFIQTGLLHECQTFSAE